MGAPELVSRVGEGKKERGSTGKDAVKGGAKRGHTNL